MVDIGRVLDGEEAGREAAQYLHERLNFPTDVPEPASTLPNGFGIDGKTKLEEFFLSQSEGMTMGLNGWKGRWGNLILRRRQTKNGRLT